MKKNILRIVSLVIVATMVFAFCSCKQEVLVRFVDKDGNDINIGALTGGSSAGNNDATEAPSGDETQAPTGDETQAPSNDTPATQAPSNDTPATQAPSNDTPATQAPAAETKAPAAETKAPAGNAAPTGKENIFNFYKTAANKIAQNGEAE